MFSLVPRFKTPSVSAALLAVTILAAAVPASSRPDSDLLRRARELLRNRIESAGSQARIVVGDEIVHASVVLPKFYERRVFRLAWSDGDGPLAQARAMIDAILNADREGLRPSDYHLTEIRSLMNELKKRQGRRGHPDPPLLVDLDLLLTDAYLILATHVLIGRVNPETIDTDWIAVRREADLAKILDEALASNTIQESLESLLPAHPDYFHLRRELTRYRAIAERGWARVPEGPKLQRGDRGERVRLLKERLDGEGFYAANSGEFDDEVFDENLERRVRHFQLRHGLEVDGVVGRATLGELNKPAEERVRQIELNLERWRWLPQDLGGEYILINIANFTLEVVENEGVVLQMRVIVGKPAQRSPVFSGKMTYLVVNPTWYVPFKIAVEEMLPAVRKDLTYLAKNNMKVVLGAGANAREIDPTTVNWAEMEPARFPYRFQQVPGPTNALGRVKFIFPNKFHVYLHDTPAPELFTRAVRTFSRGCIRVEKPIELALYLLKDDPRWTTDMFLSEIQKKVERTIPLPKPIQVHLLYWTAWVGEDGTLSFRNDIYGRDDRLSAALREEPPAAYSPN